MTIFQQSRPTSAFVKGTLLTRQHSFKTIVKHNYRKLTLAVNGKSLSLWTLSNARTGKFVKVGDRLFTKKLGLKPRPYRTALVSVKCKGLLKYTPLVSTFLVNKLKC